MILVIVLVVLLPVEDVRVDVLSRQWVFCCNAYL